MDDTIRELGEVSGSLRVLLNLGSAKLELAPLTLNDLVYLEQRFGGLENTDNIEALRCQLWLAAKRGGSSLTEEELGELIGPAALPAIRAAIEKLLAVEEGEAPKDRNEDDGQRSSG